MLTPTRRRSRKRTPKEQQKWFVTPLRLLAVVVALGALGVFSYLAARLTLSPVNDHGQAVGNTHAGRTLRFYLDRPSLTEAAKEIGGNVALLAPLGVLLPIVVSRLRGPIRIALVGGFLSLAIETVQGMFVVGRAFDVDDVILNTAGVLLAYVFIGRPLANLIRGPKS